MSRDTRKIKTELCEKLFNEIVIECDPRALKNKTDIFDMVFKIGRYKSNFAGGANDKHMTKHEQIFNLLYPNLKGQVAFGTKKGGREKYGFKKVTVDFYDSKNRIAYEIDGLNHKKELQRLKDRVKELFLDLEYGIRTIRYTNKEVEIMLKARLENIVLNNNFDEIEIILEGSGLLG